jgi:reactive intermediate/imine deaminase
MKFIQTDNALKPAGHYSQAIEHDGTIYVSGQLAYDPETGERILGEASTETLRILKNIQLILEAAGSSIQQVLKVRIYVSDINYWDDINAVYSEFFAEHKPARVVVPTRDLHYGAKVEIELTAYKE